MSKSYSTASGKKAARATIRDVATAAGVSVSSVSRVLNGGPYTSTELRARIMAVVERLGFEPDSAAQSMRSRATHTIGCVVSDISNPLYAELVNAAEDELQNNGYLLMVGSTRHVEQREVAVISALRRRRIDGLILTAGENRHEAFMEEVASLDLPCVGIDRLAPGISTVRADHLSGGREATRYLIDLGHRRIALLMGSATMLPGAERLAGYRRAYEEAGLMMEPELVRPQKLSTSFAFSEVSQMLQAANRPTAIITLGTHMLAGVLEALDRFGLRIPQDISLISMGDTDLARRATPSITALTWDLGELGRIASRVLLEQIQGDAPAIPQQIVLPTRLVLRHSCAKPGVRG